MLNFRCFMGDFEVFLSGFLLSGLSKCLITKWLCKCVKTSIFPTAEKESIKNGIIDAWL